MHSTEHKKRILHVMPSLKMGGIEKGIVDAYEHMAPLGYQFDFLLEEKTAGRLAERVNDAGGDIYAVGAFKSIVSFTYRFIKHCLRNGRYDAVHCHTYFFSGYVMLLAFLLAVPCRISHIHSANRQRNVAFLSGVYAGALKRLVDIFSSRIIAVSEGAAQSVLGDVWRNNKKIILHPVGLDITLFEGGVSSEKPLAEFGLTHDDKCLVHVGRFSAEKNHQFIVTLYKALRSKGANYKLVLIGDGPLKGGIETELANFTAKGDVIFTGERHDCIEILSSLQGVFVFPSKFEGFGLAAVEAQLCGLLVLASEGVPASVGIVPGYFKRLPLSADLDEWAGAVEQAMNVSVLPREERIEYARQSPVAMESFVTCLQKLYG